MVRVSHAFRSEGSYDFEPVDAELECSGSWGKAPLELWSVEPHISAPSVFDLGPLVLLRDICPVRLPHVMVGLKEARGDDALSKALIEKSQDADLVGEGGEGEGCLPETALVLCVSSRPAFFS